MIKSSFRALALAVFLCLCPLAAQAETTYSIIIEDLPLMPGMTESADSAVVFDTPDGRILETSVSFSAPAEETAAYYSEVLPPLGWTLLEPGVYQRDGETLSIVISANDVQFRISPKK